ncbi:MAG: carboxypeptidase regulatory-like domain-containing protein [Parcubacteria group bacterium]|nr:carboxypeptidase regulatory-like domain-containing protein [Parcubacteria group bacterium]
MTLRKRRILFYVLAVLFVVSGGGAAFYSQGFRINFETLELQKTGAVFLKSEPPYAEIKINGKIFENKTGILKSGTLIGDLTPGRYRVSVSQSGYSTWEKPLAVLPALVTEAVNIVLIPDKKSELKIQSGVDDFWINGQNIVWRDTRGVLWKKNGDKKTKIIGDAVVGWKNGSSRPIVFSKKDNAYSLVDFNNLNSSLNLNSLFNNLKERQLRLAGAVEISDVLNHPFDDNKIIIATKRAVYLLDTAKLSLEIIGEDANPSVIIAENSEIVWADDKNRIFAYNLMIKRASLIGEANGKVRALHLSSSGYYLIAEIQDNAPLLFNRRDQKTIGLPPVRVPPVFSPDEKKIAVLNSSGELKIYFLEDQIKNVNKKAGDVAFLVATAGDFPAISWHDDSFHLFLQYSKGLRFAEIDDRPPVNVAEIDGDISKISRAGGKFYALKNGDLYEIAVFED